MKKLAKILRNICQYNKNCVNELDRCIIYQSSKSVTRSYAATGWGYNNPLDWAVEFNYALGCIVCRQLC